MPNPKAARISNHGASEAQDDLTVVMQKLRAIGARPEEVRAVRDSWDDHADERTEEWRHGLLHMSDTQLRAALKEIRDEYPFEPEEQTEPFDLAPASIVTGVVGDPTSLGDGAPNIGETIPTLTAWVGEDRDRAQRVINAELADSTARGEPARVTLMRQMQAVVDAG